MTRARETGESFATDHMELHLKDVAFAYDEHRADDVAGLATESPFVLPSPATHAILTVFTFDKNSVWCI